jgi:hypothetical protein
MMCDLTESSLVTACSLSGLAGSGAGRNRRLAGIKLDTVSGSPGATQTEVRDVRVPIWHGKESGRATAPTNARLRPASQASSDS